MSQWRILKKIAPTGRGAKLLAAEFGTRLVCVRHRLDPSGSKRLTTVELVISERPIAQKPSPLVSLATDSGELELHKRLRQAGARWDGVARVWRLRRATAVALGLKKRIVP